MLMNFENTCAGAILVGCLLIDSKQFQPVLFLVTEVTFEDSLCGVIKLTKIHRGEKYFGSSNTLEVAARSNCNFSIENAFGKQYCLLADSPALDMSINLIQFDHFSIIFSGPCDVQLLSC